MERLRRTAFDYRNTYKIAESSKPADELTDLDQYVFVVRQRIGKFVERLSVTLVLTGMA